MSEPVSDLSASRTLHSPEQLDFCQRLPKIELHAHLNGSLRESTVRELAIQKGVDVSLIKLAAKGDRTLAECFRLFDVIHQVTTDHETITRITTEVIEDFATENVMYLELRTTPKDRPQFGMTKRSYLEAVLAGMQRYQDSVQEDAEATLVRLLLSIDRREGPEAALETVELAAELRGRGVAGVDLSGNPAVGEWASWEGALRRAQELGLPLTLHAGEVYSPAETAAILALRPQRLGHMCYLDEALDEQLRASAIPLELCLSSNVVTRSAPSYDLHHFQPLYKAGHPVVLCTDDAGVFNTSLSREYAIAASAFQLDEAALLGLARRSIEYTFLEEPERERLRQRLAAFQAEVGLQETAGV